MFNFKRHKDSVEQADLRRTRTVDRSTANGSGRALSYHANRSSDDTNVGRGRSLQAVSPDRLTPSYGKFWTFSSRAGTIVLLLAIIAVVFELLTLSPTPKVVALSSSTSQVFLQAPSVYQNAATALFTSSLLNRNKLTINTNAISVQLKHEFPELTAVSVDLPLFGHYPIVYIQPSEPSLVLISQLSGSFVLNSDGEALIGASNQTAQLASLNVPTVVDQSGLPVAIGQTVLASTTVSFVTTIAAQLHAQHIGYTSMVLPNTASELDVYLNGEPYYARFNTEDNSALQQVGTLIAVIKRLQAEGVTPHDYIDVMVDGRAYYK